MFYQSATFPAYPVKLDSLEDKFNAQEGWTKDLKYFFYISQLGGWIPMEGIPYKLTTHLVYSGQIVSKKLVAQLIAGLRSAEHFTSSTELYMPSFRFPKNEPTQEQLTIFVDEVTQGLGDDFSEDDHAFLKANPLVVLGVGVLSDVKKFDQCVNNLSRAVAKKNQINVPEDPDEFNNLDDETVQKIRELNDNLFTSALEKAGLEIEAFKLRMNHYEIDRLETQVEGSSELELSLTLDSYDWTVKDSIKLSRNTTEQNQRLIELTEARAQAYKAAIKDLLFLAVCAADTSHLAALLKDPETLSVARAEGGLLLDRVINSPYSIEPFQDGEAANPEGILEILSAYTVIDQTDPAIVEKIEGYKAFFTKQLPNFLTEQPAGPVVFGGAATRAVLAFSSARSRPAPQPPQVDEDEDEEYNPFFDCSVM